MTDHAPPEPPKGRRPKKQPQASEALNAVPELSAQPSSRKQIASRGRNGGGDHPKPVPITPARSAALSCVHSESDGAVTTGQSPYPSTEKPKKHHRRVRSHNPSIDSTIAMPQLDGAPSDFPPQHDYTNDLGHPQLNSTTPSKQIYAGPTFHASPAPSSLPMPKFFSKSMPSGPSALQARMDASETNSGPPTPEPTPHSTRKPPATEPPVRRDESPLDVFFNAQRAERERQRSGSTPQNRSSSGAYLTPPPAEPKRAVAPQTMPNMRNRRPSPYNSRPSSRNPDKEAFMRELDGTEDEETDAAEATYPDAPLFGSQSSQRPSAAASTEHLISDEEERNNKTQALKKLLLVGGGAPTSEGDAPRVQRREENKAPFQPREGGDVKAMENDLKRMLRLDGSSGSGAGFVIR